MGRGRAWQKFDHGGCDVNREGSLFDKRGQRKFFKRSVTQMFVGRNEGEHKRVNGRNDTYVLIDRPGDQREEIGGLLCTASQDPHSRSAA